jgi:hypothetical protein
MRQAVCQIAIVGQQHQSFALCVKAANREDAHVVRDELEHGRPSVRIACGRDHPHRFVQEEVAMGIGRLRDVDDLPIDRNNIAIRIGTRAEFAHDTAIHGDPSLQDHVLCRAKRRNAGASKNFV